jgi:hypothetical protein
MQVQFDMLMGIKLVNKFKLNIIYIVIDILDIIPSSVFI